MYNEILRKIITQSSDVGSLETYADNDYTLELSMMSESLAWLKDGTSTDTLGRDIPLELTPLYSQLLYILLSDPILKMSVPVESFDSYQTHFSFVLAQIKRDPYVMKFFAELLAMDTQCNLNNHLALMLDCLAAENIDQAYYYFININTQRMTDHLSMLSELVRLYYSIEFTASRRRLALDRSLEELNSTYVPSDLYFSPGIKHSTDQLPSIKSLDLKVTMIRLNNYLSSIDQLLIKIMSLVKSLQSSLQTTEPDLLPGFNYKN